MSEDEKKLVKMSNDDNIDNWPEFSALWEKLLDEAEQRGIARTTESKRLWWLCENAKTEAKK